MRTPCSNDGLTRRSLIQLGLATAATMATPWPMRRLAMAQTAAPHFLVVMICDGGWDVTQVFDLDATRPEWALAFRFDIVLRGRGATPFEEPHA